MPEKGPPRCLIDPMSEQNGKRDRHSWRRREGRWVWPGKDLERGKTTKGLALRLLYLLMPVIGIMCSQEAYVRPHLMAFEDGGNREKKVFIDKRDNLQLRLSDLGNDTLNTIFEMDTTVVPQIAFYEEILDSLLAIRQTYDRTLPVTEAIIDSLGKVREELDEKNLLTRALYERHVAARDSLRGEVLKAEELLTALADTIRAKDARVYRILHPEDFRKGTAIFPGPGDYPDRDSLPRR